MSEKPTIVVVEDNDDDFLYLEMAVKSDGYDVDLVRCCDEEDFNTYFESLYLQESSSPLFFVVDLHLPGITGLDIIEQLRSVKRLRKVPVIIFSSSEQDHEIASVYEKGANSFIKKPFQSHDFMTKVKSFFKYWVDTAYIPYKVSA